MKTLLKTALTLSLLASSLPAHAQMQDPLLELPEGQVMLSISATERKEVEEDLLVGTLAYVVTHREAAQVQDQINKAMNKGLKEAKDIDELKVSTGSYQVYETTLPRTKEKQWRGQQSITLKSMDADAVLEAAGKLQEMGFTMNGLEYTLAPETMIKVQDSLMEDALVQLQERANRAAKALGKSSAELRDVNVQGINVPYGRIMQGRAASMGMAESAMAAPVASAGEAAITLNVNARAILKP